MGQFKDITGLKFGLLEALYRAESHITPSGKSITMWMCRCECGTEKAIRYGSLIGGDTKTIAEDKGGAWRIRHTIV